MQEIGVVESINEKNGTAKVVFDRKAACDKCRMCLTANGDKMKVYVEVKNTLNAKVGDKVGVTMSDGFVLKAAFIVYLLPVILVGVGLAIFRKLSDFLLLAVVGAGLVLGFGAGVLIDRLIRKKGTNAPQMSGVYPPGTPLPGEERDEHNDDASAKEEASSEQGEEAQTKETDVTKE